ncbi:polyubiquitin-B-like [Neoarius graeffei]|uniref:polyubiquitin-B-like n=1 Tax=Neoarius graeffei TaxID=443677 RepID=UPI00298BEEB5|nr:polyubiquitin-B-like [Neoarius graeffei]
MELIIKDLNGKMQVVNVLPSTTIGELKQQIATLFGATASCLRLSDSSGQILDELQKTVSDYGLSSGSTLILLISTTPVPFQVFVKNEKGQIKTYNITDDETVDQLMAEICQIEGVPVDQQRLIYNGQQLKSGRKLKDYNIISGSTIYMTLRLRGG